MKSIRLLVSAGPILVAVFGVQTSQAQLPPRFYPMPAFPQPTFEHHGWYPPQVTQPIYGRPDHGYPGHWIQVPLQPRYPGAMHGFPRGPYHEPSPQPNLHAHGVGNSGHGGPASSSSLGCKINPVLVPGKGYLVLHVHPGSFSERNGVRPGDYVIGVNGVNLKSPLSRFVATASLVLNGLRGQLTFERPSGQRYDVVMR